MLHFNLTSPVYMLWFGEFISPERGWVHLTRTLYDYEMMAVTEGTLCIADEREEYTVHAGEYLIMSPTRYQHGTRECKCRFFWMHFQCPALPASVTLPDHGKMPDIERVRTTATQLFSAEREQPRGLRSQYLASLMLLGLASPSGEKPLPIHMSPAQELCEKIKSFIEWHRFSDNRISDIAKELGYHEKYLSTVFHATEGITLKRYLTEQRAKEAKRLLLETNMSITEVAYFLNFQNPHNFSRFFKETTGMTPLAYRNLGRDDI